MPFGLKSTQQLFNKVWTLLSGIEGALAHLDDIIIVGLSKQNLLGLRIFPLDREMSIVSSINKIPWQWSTAMVVVLLLRILE